MLPKRLSREVIYESPYINLYTDKVLLPTGRIIDKYHLLSYPKKSVVVLLTNQKQEICFVKSPRYATQKIEFELPAGIIDPGEDVLEAAKRETQEETGYQVQTAKLIYHFHPDTSLSDQIVYAIYCTTKDNQPMNFDKIEVQSVHWFSKIQIQNMIKRQTIHDACSLIPLLLYLNKNIST